MVLVGHAHRHHYLAYAKVELRCKRLLNPELLQGHLAALFHFSLIFAALVGIHLNGTLRSAVLELNLHAHAPAVTEVIAHVQCDVGQVEASVGTIVLVFLGKLVAVEMVAVEVAAHHCLAVAAQAQALLCVFVILSQGRRCGQGQQRSHQDGVHFVYSHIFVVV